MGVSYPSYQVKEQPWSDGFGEDWVILDSAGQTVAQCEEREQAFEIVEGLILREFMWQTGLKLGCWHVFSPVPYRESDDPLAAWQMTCLECGGFFGMKPPTQQKSDSCS